MSDVGAGVKVLLFGLAGIILAAILYLLNEEGTFVDEFIVGSETITITEIMAVVIIFFLIIGVVYAVASE